MSLSPTLWVEITEANLGLKKKKTPTSREKRENKVDLVASPPGGGGGQGQHLNQNHCTIFLQHTD